MAASAIEINDELSVSSDNNIINYILIGKSGIGKSTTGNKLIGHYDRERENYEIKRDPLPGFQESCKKTQHNSNQGIETRSQERGGLEENSNDYNMFKEATNEDIHTVTVECELITNSSLNVRVLDVPGFEGVYKSYPVKDELYRINRCIIRDITQAQSHYRLVFHRVIYFMPNRGCPEKNDGILQNEINILNYFFGESIFKRMVVVLTSSPFDAEVNLIDDKTIDCTKKVFSDALNTATNGRLTFCPDVIYISKLDDRQAMCEKLSKTSVLSQAGLSLSIRKEVCKKCALSMYHSTERQKDINDDESQRHNYRAFEEKCHPLFIPKHSMVKRIKQGIFIAGTLGLAKTCMPGFDRSEECCISCKGYRGTPGCTKVGDTYKNPKNITKITKHSIYLEEPFMIKEETDFADEESDDIYRK